MSIQTLSLICYVWIALALAVFITMFFITAPFGRHTSDKWGLSINNKLGWFIMEAPSFLIMLYFLLYGSNSMKSYAWILFALWIIHYTNRTFIYPLRIRPTPKKMPLFIVGSAIFFNVVNAGINGYYLAELAPLEKYNESWLMTPTFVIGGILFFAGITINWIADTMLIHLRKPGEIGYVIPKGFLFSYVSSPNLFGEMIEWSGFALMAWNLPACTFMIWTFANLLPRAKNHHDWYHHRFADYPKERKAAIPFLF